MSSQQPQSNQPNKPNQPRGSWRHLLIWIPIILLVAMFWGYTVYSRNHNAKQMTFTQFVQDVRQDKVASVTLSGQGISGHFKNSDQKSNANKNPQNNVANNMPLARGQTGGPRETPDFTTTRPPFGGERLLDLLQKHKVQIAAKSNGGSWWKRLLIGFLPWLLILGVGIFFFRRMQQRMGGGGQGGGAFGMGKSKAKRHREGSTGVRMTDVAGAEQAKQDLVEIVDYLKDPQRYTALGAKIPRGVLMMGAPGVGKTLLAKAVAGEADVPFYSISGSEFIEMFVGVGAARVRDMFNNAKSEAPALIFIDEMDAIGRARGSGSGMGGHDEREQTLNQILTEMDGFNTYETVVVLAATNRPDVLDPALTRPGRFDRKVSIERPAREARLSILQVHARDKPMAEDVDLNVLAERTPGFSGAELENLLNEAALMAGRGRHNAITMDILNQARDLLVFGAERDTGLNEEEKRVVAYHESGHALMAYLLPRADPLDKITIIPRGRALGATEQIPREERYNLSISYLYDRIGVMLGGHMTERLIFGEVTTGAEQDLRQVSQMARHMIANWGMNERLGPMFFNQDEDALGGQKRDFSERTAYEIDTEVRDLVGDVASQVYNKLRANRDKLDALANELMARETLGIQEIRQLLDPGQGSEPSEQEVEEIVQEEGKAVPEAYPAAGEVRGA